MPEVVLRWHTIHNAATNLPQAFFDENSPSLERRWRQKEPTPRWKQCTG